MLIENQPSAHQRVFTRSDAALRVVRACQTWAAPLAGLTLLLPSFLRDAVYNFIAARRRALNRVCAVSSALEPERFLT